MTKTILFSCCFLGAVSLFSLGRAGQKTALQQSAQVVTTERLGIDDVKKSVMHCLESQDCMLGEVLGIHQDGNSANVYVRYAYKSRKNDILVYNLIRFNSGKWYNVSLKDFVTR